MSRIYVPATGLSDWQKLLAEPNKQWKPDHSAMLVAETWQAANGKFPQAIALVLADAKDELLHSLTPLIILPEHQVSLPGGVAASQNDVWVLASHVGGLASITVEGKVAEPFGKTISEWLVNASEGKKTRLAFLTQTLGLPAVLPVTIRYQLLHRVVSAILEAKRFRANVALCIVQSFSPVDEGFADFEAFCSLFGKLVKPGEVIALGQHEGVPFYAVWVQNPLAI